MMKTSFNLGHQVFFCSFNDISIKKNIPSGNIKLIKKFDNTLSFFTEQTLNLNILDTIFIRKDPPFDKDYLFLTITLDLLRKTKIINHPKSLQSHNEKCLFLNFPTLFHQLLFQVIILNFKVLLKNIDQLCVNLLMKWGGIKFS